VVSGEEINNVILLGTIESHAVPVQIEAERKIIKPRCRRSPWPHTI